MQARPWGPMVQGGGGAVVGCKLLAEIFPVDDDLIDVFREPIVGHKIIAVMAVVFAPAILDAPKAWASPRRRSLLPETPSHVS